MEDLTRLIATAGLSYVRRDPRLWIPNFAKNNARLAQARMHAQGIKPAFKGQKSYTT